MMTNLFGIYFILKYLILLIYQYSFSDDVSFSEFKIFCVPNKKLLISKKE